MSDWQAAKDHLQSGGYTCVLCRGDAVVTSTLRGVKPLMQWLNGDGDFGGFCAADKVVGKATAFLYVLLGVRAVYAGVISEAALAVLETNGIAVEYGERVEHIINRRKDGICPFEAAVDATDDPQRAYAIIRDTMKTMQTV